MKDLLYDMLIFPFIDADGWFDYFMGILMWFVALVVIGLLIWLCVWLIDSSFMPIKENDGVVTNKYIIPAYSTTTFITSNNMMIPMTTYYDETYNVEITVDGLKDGVSMRYSDWQNVSVNQRVHCKYTNGRLLKSLYIKSFN